MGLILSRGSGENDRAYCGLRRFSLLAALLFALLFAACAKPEERPADTPVETTAIGTESAASPEPTAQPDPAQTAAPTDDGAEKELKVFAADGEPSVPAEKRSMTLMIYMVGSDLESKGGAAVSDLSEIVSSGADVSAVNVLVYTGGTTKWHNENIPVSQNCFLSLTDDGFCCVSMTDTVSMGEAESLAAFLNAAVTGFPADRYALILWDHGNGPVQGYGKDELFQKDSLLLKEMRQGMEQTPFGKDLRLEWVGFDACLMASAELACVWSPYAAYLVASQETEPSIGWDYGFLSELNTVDTVTLLRDLSDRYMNACLALYEQRGTAHRDTTLSVLDLSAAEPLGQAIDALFSAACADVGERFDTLAACRVNTRALAKGSTASDYDIVDLGDLAVQMREAYPEEADALSEAVKTIVLSNETNAERLCGLSLYYPFYNKAYYRRQWAEIYKDLGLFPMYQSYLLAYAETWLKDDLKAEYAFSDTPRLVSEGLFALDLTEEQAAHFASARFYILANVGGESYVRVFTGADVRLEGTTLYAEYKGKSIYAVDPETRATASPFVEEIESRDGLSYYSVKAILSDQTGEDSVFVRITVCVDEATETLSIVSIHEDKAANTRAGETLQGKQEDIDPYAYAKIEYPLEERHLLVRDDSDVVKPFDDWMTDSFSMMQSAFAVKNGLSLCYDYPTTDRNYVIVYEIRDTQNNSYCSEPLPFETDRAQNESSPMGNDGALIWEADQKELTVRSEDGLTVRLVRGGGADGHICLEFENRTDRGAALFTVTQIAYVESIAKYNAGDRTFYYGTSALKLYAGPGETVTEALSFGASESFDDPFISAEAIAFPLAVFEATGAKDLESHNAWTRLKPIWDFSLVFVASPEQFRIRQDDFAQGTLNDWLRAETFMNTSAEPQVLYEDGSMRLTLTDYVPLSILGDGKGDLLLLYLLCENLSETDSVKVDVPLASVNGMTEEAVRMEPMSIIPPNGAKRAIIVLPFARYSISTMKQQIGVRSIESIRLAFATYSELADAMENLRWCEIQLKEHGPAEATVPQGETVFSEGGITLSFLSEDPDTHEMYFLLENRTLRDVSVGVQDLAVGGQNLPENINSAGWEMRFSQLGPNQTRICVLRARNAAYRSDAVIETISFRPMILTIMGDRVIRNGESTVEIRPGS